MPELGLGQADPDLLRAFADPWYHAITGLAGNLNDSLAHQHQSLQAEVDQLFVYYSFARTAGDGFGPLAFWWEGTQASDAPGGGPAVVPSPGSSVARPDSLKAVKCNIDFFGAFALAVSCEKVDVTVAAPGLGPFAQLSYPRKGDWTVFAGIGGSLPGTGIGAKAGVYLKGNDMGYSDAGMKFSQSVGVGPLKYDSPFGFEAGIAAAKQCFLGCS